MESQGHFDRGLIELDQYLLHFDEAALLRAIASFRVAARLTPDSSRHWSALGYALDAAERPEEALAAFRKAQAVDPEDEEVNVFILALISEAGLEEYAMAGVVAHAEHLRVDLEALRHSCTCFWDGKSRGSARRNRSAAHQSAGNTGRSFSVVAETVSCRDWSFATRCRYA